MLITLGERDLRSKGVKAIVRIVIKVVLVLNIILYPL